MTTNAATLTWTRNQVLEDLLSQITPNTFLEGDVSMEGHNMETVEDIEALGDLDAAMAQTIGVELLDDLPEDYDLRRSVRVILRRSQMYYLVTSDTNALHGIGSTPDEAIEDFKYALLDYYDMLNQNRGALAPHLQSHLEQLDKLIQHS